MNEWLISSLPPPGDIAIRRVCRLVRSFVRLLISSLTRRRSDLSKSRSPTFMKLSVDVRHVRHMPLLHVNGQSSRSKPLY